MRVIDYVTRKCGRENVAQIITFGTMKAKAVMHRRGARAGHAVRGCRSDCQADPAGARHDARQGADREPVLKDMVAEKARSRKSSTSAGASKGQPPRPVRAAGVMIAPGPITDYAPLYKGSALRRKSPRSGT